jgi:hypothetical protein
LRSSIESAGFRHNCVATLGSPVDAEENYTRENLLDQLQRYAYYGTAAALSMGLEQDQAVSYKLRDDFNGGMSIPNAARYYTVGRGIAGTPVAGPTGEARLGIPYGAATIEEGLRDVAELKSHGVHFVKIWVDDRVGTVPKLRPEVYRATPSSNRRTRTPSRCSPTSVNRQRSPTPRTCSRPTSTDSCTWFATETLTTNTSRW